MFSFLGNKLKTPRMKKILMRGNAVNTKRPCDDQVSVAHLIREIIIATTKIRFKMIGKSFCKEQSLRFNVFVANIIKPKNAKIETVFRLVYIHDGNATFTPPKRPQ